MRPSIFVLCIFFGILLVSGGMYFLNEKIKKDNEKAVEYAKESNRQLVEFRKKYMGVPFQMNGATYTATVAPNWGRTYTCVNASGNTVELEQDVLVKLVDASR